jgi:pyruvate dehydrogenase E2 component (dihydrolipoamide acetyltransferase)
MSEGIIRLGMPKWGLSMTEGQLVAWLVEEGAELETGDEVAEAESEKINGTVEAPASGVLRRRVAQEGETIPVGGLLGVIAEPGISDEEIDAFVEEFQASFVPGEAEEEAGPEPETVEVGGRSIRYLKHGEGGEAVILLHGFGGDLNNWLFNQEPLADGRTVYALDFPGHGGSTKETVGSLEELAEVVSRFMEALGLDRAHLVGHSMGGAVASKLALTEPEKVASLVLIASAGLGEEINEEYIEGFIAAERRKEMKSVLQMLFADPKLVTRDLVNEVLKYKRLDGVDESLRVLADGVFPGGKQKEVLARELAESEVPVLVIWGGEDRVLPVEHAGSLDGARIEVLEGQGHMVQMEAAGEVNRRIQAFLNSS